MSRNVVLQKNIIENFFDREVSRLAFVEERRNTRALEITKNKDDEKPKKQTVRNIMAMGRQYDHTFRINYHSTLGSVGKRRTAGSLCV